MSSSSIATVAAASTTSLTRNQKRGFMAAWGGWALDGMDASIYALVLVPALTELLPRSGIAVSQGTVGYYGSILQAMFLLGWGLSMVWGPISDRIGRVRALMLTILCYSVFTFMCGLVNNIWQLAILRVLVGLGIGGEQPVGAAYLAEELSESQRKIGAGLMHTGYYFGFFFASVANYFIGANFGWRWMFVFGGLPALLIGFIRYGVQRVDEVAGDVRRRQGARAPEDARRVCQAVLADVPAPDDGDVGAVPRRRSSDCGRDRSTCPRRRHSSRSEPVRRAAEPRDWRRTAGWCSRSARSSDALPRRSSPNASAAGRRWRCTSSSWRSASSSRSGTCSTWATAR